MRHLVLLAAAFAVSCIGPLAAATPAVRIDPAGCVIIAPARPNAVVDYAVQELQVHLLLVTGRTVPIAAAVQPGQFPFYVGAVPATDTTPLAAEEARWEISPGGVWLYGKDEIHRRKAAKGGGAREAALASDTEAGTLFAVYEFLENALGVKWIEPGDAGITYRVQSPLTLSPGKGAWVPQLVQRHMRTAYKDTLRERALADAHIPPDMQFTPEEFARRQREEAIWRRRMRMGGDVNFTYGHAFRDWWAKYGKTHPEYFALGKWEARP
jgi:hypothetical protein